MTRHILANTVRPGDKIDGDAVTEIVYSSVDGTLWLYGDGGDEILAVVDYHDIVTVD